MQKFDDYIKNIQITPLGKFFSTFPSKCTYTFDDIKTKNGILTADKDFIMQAGDFNPSATLVDPTQNLNLSNIRVEEIIYEQVDGSNIITVESLTLVSTSRSDTVKICNLGLKPVSILSTHIDDELESKFQLGVRELYWLLSYKETKLAYWLMEEYHLYIVLETVGLQAITDKNRLTTNYIKDNTRLEKLKVWRDKMSLIGLIDEYKLSDNGLRMYDYTGTSENPSIPPVKLLRLNQSKSGIKSLTVPSTVEVIQSLPKSVENLDITRAYNLHKLQNSTPLFKNTKDRKLDFTKIILMDFDDILKTIDINNKLDVKINYLQLLNISDIIRTELYKLTAVNI